MPKSGKGKGRKAGGSQRQLGTPGLSNAPPKHKTPEPEQRQLATPSATPNAVRKAPVQLPLRTLRLIEEEKEREKKELRDRKKVVGAGVEKNVKRFPEGDSDVELFERCPETDEESDEDEVTCGPWVAKGNAPGYLDSDDEAELEEFGVVLAREKRDSIPDWQWKELGDFFIHHISAFLEVDLEAQGHILDELLGEFDEDGEESGKCRISLELDKVREKMETIQGLEDEVDELKERLERERKWNNVLGETNRGLMEERRNTEAEEKFEKLSNFLADTIRCSRGRPVATLIGAVEDHFEKLEVRSREDPKFRNLKSETQRKTEELKKVKEEKKVWVQERRELEEELASVRRQLEREQTLTRVLKPDKKVEVAEVGTQVSPEMVDTATEPQEEILVKEKREKRQRGSKGKGKKKEGAKDSRSAGDTPPAKNKQTQEDVEMVDEERFSLYEDLSDYEKELDEAPVTPPVTKKQPTKRQVGPKGARTPTAKYKKPTKPVKEKEDYIDTRAFVVHGIPCQRPVADTTQDVKKTGMRGVIGARWLLGGQRRMGKTTSSVVIFLKSPVSFHVQGGQMRMKVRGYWLPVDVYDFERGRVRPEVRGTDVL